MTYESMPILLVEDNYNDVLLIQRAFRKAKIEPLTSVVSDGDEAILYLQGKGRYSDRSSHPIPQLILLDLKLPRRSGLEVLSWIRQQPQLKRLLVLVLTSSQEDSDLAQAYDLGGELPTSNQRLRCRLPTQRSASPCKHSSVLRGLESADVASQRRIAPRDWR